MADGRVAPFDGDLDDYRDWVLGLRSRGAAAEGPSPAGPRRRRTAGRRSGPRPRRGRRTTPAAGPSPSASGESRPAIADLAREKKDIEDWLSLPAAPMPTSTASALKEKVARQGDLAWQLARLETEWLELSEALEGPRRRLISGPAPPAGRRGRPRSPAYRGPSAGRRRANAACAPASPARPGRPAAR
ncbi:MAG: hypothetical protein MZW92_44180, partial [Comamonadaceae bacterium]|nr:hypothetical protein [Comamonadaceae bacterium]